MMCDNSIGTTAMAYTCFKTTTLCVILFISLQTTTTTLAQVNPDVWSHIQAHTGLRDTICTDHADYLAGLVPSVVVCAWKCAAMTGCRGFFYNAGNAACTLVYVIAVPQTGCQQQLGTKYYIMLEDGLFDCYNFTGVDLARIGNPEPEMDVCMSYDNHVVKDHVTASSHYGCDDGCPCCKTRGCYSGAYNLYVGTWSISISGRVCQRWDSQTPHSHTRDETWAAYPPGENATSAENYCRDPDGEGFLWCYTVDPGLRWESCGIPECY